MQFDGHHQFEEIDTESDPPIGKLRNPRLVSRVCEAVAKVVGDHAKKGQLPLTLGGDHSLVSRALRIRRVLDDMMENLIGAGDGNNLRDIRVSL